MINMAHFVKYKADVAWITIDHDKRGHTKNRENIDSERSNLNYNLADPENEKEYLSQLLEKARQSGATIRADTNILCSVVITLPEDFLKNKELERQFFIACLELIENDFGKENIISAWVHYDENLANVNRPNKPHIHIKFAPVREKVRQYKDKSKRTVYSFDAKNCVNRSYLRQFHTRLSDWIEDALGFKANVINGKTKYGNKTIDELKAISAAKREAEKVLSMTPPEQLVEHQQNQRFKNKRKREKEHIDQMWKKYQAISNEYWRKYKSQKKQIDNYLYELKHNISSAEQQLRQSLDFVHNLSYGIFYALFELLNAVFLYSEKKYLQTQQDTLKKEFESLNKTRQSISNFQHNAKFNLKNADIQQIERSLSAWEQAVIQANIMLSETLMPTTPTQEKVEDKTTSPEIPAKNER